jgi:glycosyltransferase involved in cell wall biosynthesis
MSKVAPSTSDEAMSYQLMSVVLPIQNQSDYLAEVVGEYQAVLMPMSTPHELLLVANGCRDGSFEVCEALARSASTVRVIGARRAGWGLAVKLGLSAASGDLLCFTNSARTSASDLALLLQCACDNPQVIVKASRTLRDSWQRRVGSLLYNLECRLLFDLPTWDVNGTPKAFPRTFDKLLHLTRDDDLIDAEFGVIVAQERYPSIEVPILSTRRRGGRSTTNYRSAWRLYVGAYQTARGLRQVRRTATVQ